MADPRVTIARRELGSLRAEKTIVLALVIQLFIAAFSSFLVVGLVSLYAPGNVGSYHVNVAVTGDARGELMDAMDGSSGIVAQEFSDPARARDAFQRGQVQAVVNARHHGDRVVVDAAVPDENIETTVVVVQVREMLLSFERAQRAKRARYLTALPLDLPPKAGGSPYYGFTYTVLVPLLLFLPVFISGSISVDSLSEEFERGTMELLRVAPVTVTDIVDGKLLTAVGLAPAQAALWLALLAANGTPVDNPLSLLALVAALAVIVTSLGASVALLAPDRRAAQFLYSVGVLVVFGGSTLLPRSPANTAARLAIGSAGPDAQLAVGVTLVAAVACYLGLRGVVARVDVAAQ